MLKVIIVINAEIQEKGRIIPISPATDQMVNTLKQVIQQSSQQATEIEVITTANLPSKALPDQKAQIIYCPLTIELPSFFDFPAQNIYKACKDIYSMRQWVKQQLNYKIIMEPSELGHLWLPVILTAKGPIYGEVIGEGAIPNCYYQPIDLDDQKRQSLYSLSYQLVQFFQAPPAVYLLQFSCLEQQIIFDRLWPFPAAPALASLGVQQPDLFTCHWYCLTNRAIPEIIIKL